MRDDEQKVDLSNNIASDISGKTNRLVTTVLKVMLVCGAILELIQGNWLAALATIGVIIVVLLPVALSRQFEVKIPPEFELLAVVFVIASLFLGEVQGYYLKFWWWDLLLHGASGLILGMFGFILVHVLNEKDDLHLSLKPSFVAFFAFLFALGVGTLWEIMEFTVDHFFATNMQKSGLADTMGDLIVDGIGAMIISVLGYFYLRTIGSDSFLERWIQHFIQMNRHLFRKDNKGDLS
ncbi:MAG: hypothetical protein ACU84Q_11795 [Gammaproteobacteria bacterium]